MEITEKMLQAAMKKAIEHGLVPRSLAREDYFHNLKALRDILQAALAPSDEIRTAGEPTKRSEE